MGANHSTTTEPSAASGPPACTCPAADRGVRCTDRGCPYGPVGVLFNARFHCRACWQLHNARAARPQSTVTPHDVIQTRRAQAGDRCRHLGAVTTQTAQCGSCKGGTLLKIYECAMFGRCTIAPGRKAAGVASCSGCQRWQPVATDRGLRDVTQARTGPAAGVIAPSDVPEGKEPLRWAVGLTTVPERKDDLLPRTLESLAAAGFGGDEIRLFVDGAGSPEDVIWWQNRHGPDVTFRRQRIRCAGSWVLALAELALRQPHAQRYAIFQDDLIASRNLKRYLEVCPFPERGYLNLYTFASNQVRAPRLPGRADQAVGWFQSNQLGRGALGLVFDREGALTVLSSRHVWKRAEHPDRGHKAIDGGIVTAMQQAGWTEWVHNPSPLQHTGRVSAAGNLPHQDAPSFRGADYDLLTLVEEAKMQRH